MDTPHIAYVVTGRETESEPGFYLVGVFSSEEKAAACIAKREADRYNGGHVYTIEQWTMDDETPWWERVAV